LRLTKKKKIRVHLNEKRNKGGERERNQLSRRERKKLFDVRKGNLLPGPRKVEEVFSAYAGKTAIGEGGVSEAGREREGFSA